MIPRLLYILVVVAFIGGIPAVAQDGENTFHVIGFGLVTGLNGTGSKSVFTEQVAQDVLARLGKKVDPNTDGPFKSGNIAAVMLTAEIKPGDKIGSKIEVTISALDDSTSLAGGVLILAPLKGVDGLEYASAQGAIVDATSIATSNEPQMKIPVGKMANNPVLVRQPAPTGKNR